MRESAVLRALAERFAKTRAGRTGKAARDFIFDYERLLNEASCAVGEERVCAVRELDALDGDLLTIKRHRLGNPETIRFPVENEARLFALLGVFSPGERRSQLADCFRAAQAMPVPQVWAAGWNAFCLANEKAALDGGNVRPFDREDLDETREILALLPELLKWTGSAGASPSRGGESLMRFASSYLCGDSKRLEQLQRKLEACLQMVTGDTIKTLADLGITANERSLLIHGPVRLVLGDAVVELGAFAGPVRISMRDLERATFETDSTRCLTVENAAMLQELCKLGSGVILVSSGSEGGFANSAVITLLKELPQSLEYWHFGDSDPAGFDILRDLRERSGRQISSMHMRFQNGGASTLLSREDAKTIERLLASEHLTAEEKAELQKMKSAGNLGRFEQESLGLPKREWPFYIRF